MNNHQLRKLTVILLASISLLACNGGNSSSNSSSATTANPLQQYIDLLSYTPAQGKQLSGAIGNQQSFSTPGGIQINSVDIKYYSGANCSGTVTSATTLNGPSTPPAGIYTSTNTSNYALCQKYAGGGCQGLFDSVTIMPPAVRSMQYTYNLDSGSIATQCLYNPNNNPFDTGAFETIMDYSDPQLLLPCVPGSSCGYSQSYSAISLFTPIIALPQTGQTPSLPMIATAGMDGYTYIGVPWAYVTSGATDPATRFSIGSGAEAGCITDNLTGLMWVKDLNTVAINGKTAGSFTTWQNALDSIATANSGAGYCGHKDWYLPTVNDLSSLLNDGYTNGGTNYQSEWLISQGFSNVQAYFYWSSTTYAGYTGYAWVVDFDDGYVYAYNKGYNHYVWPVRGGL